MHLSHQKLHCLAGRAGINIGLGVVLLCLFSPRHRQLARWSLVHRWSPWFRTRWPSRRSPNPRIPLQSRFRQPFSGSISAPFWRQLFLFFCVRVEVWQMCSGFWRYRAPWLGSGCLIVRVNFLIRVCRSAHCICIATGSVSKLLNSRRDRQDLAKKLPRKNLSTLLKTLE